MEYGLCISISCRYMDVGINDKVLVLTGAVRLFLGVFMLLDGVRYSS